MKKLFNFIILISVLALLLSSCGYKQNEWITEEKLSKCLIPDFPEIQDNYVVKGDGDIYVKLSEEEYKAYVSQVYDYLKSKNFEYLGTRGELHSSLSGAFNTYYFKPADTLEDFYVDGAYRFVYSDGIIEELDDTFRFRILTINTIGLNTTKTIEDDGIVFKYNTVIRLRYNSEYPLNGRYVLPDSDPEHEHTGEMHSSETGHYYQYTCGCESNDIAELHSDYDSDLICDICGYEIKNTDPIFPDSGIIPITEYEPWLNKISEADVKEIKTIYCYGVSYEELRSIISTTNKDIISTMISDLRLVDVEHNDLVSYEIPAGSFEIEFYLTDGSVKRIVFNGGGLFYNGQPVNRTPTLDRESFTDISKIYSFVSYGRFTDVYYRDNYSSLANGFKIGRINPEMLEFTECECVGFDDVERRYYYYFDTALGGISTFGETHFILDGVMYEIVNYPHADLSEIQTIKTAHENKFNDGRVAFVDSYYGTFESGAIVAMLTDDKIGYHEALWSETIAEYTFRYHNGNRIVVLYDGEFYTLPEAYESGYLTLTDIHTVWKLRS